MFLVRAVIFSTFTAAELHLVPGDGGPGEAGDGGVHLELGEDGGERFDHAVVGGAAGLARAAALQQVERGQEYVMSPESWSCSARPGSPCADSGAGLVRSGTPPDRSSPPSGAGRLPTPGFGRSSLSASRAPGTGVPVRSRSTETPWVRSATTGEGGMPLSTAPSSAAAAAAATSTASSGRFIAGCAEGLRVRRRLVSASSSAWSWSWTGSASVRRAPRRRVRSGSASRHCSS